MRVAKVKIKAKVQRELHKRMEVCASACASPGWGEGMYAGALHHIRYPITEAIRNLITMPLREAIEDDRRP